MIDGNQTYGDHLEIHKNIESLCCVSGTNTVLYSIIFQKNSQKKIRFVVTRGQEEEELDENSQKVQRYKLTAIR